MSSATRWTVAILIMMQCVVVAGMARRDGPFDHIGMDYLTTWIASDMVLHGDAGRLYDTRAQWAYQLPVIERYNVHWDDRVMHPYLAPPPLAIVGLPLGFLPPVAALVVWMALSIGAIGLAVRRIAAAFDIDWRSIAPLLAGSMPLFMLVMLGQADALLALAFAIFAAQLRQRNDGRAGVALAALAIKPQLLVAPLVYLLVTGRRRAVIAAGLSGLVEAIVSVAVIGTGGLKDELVVSRRMAGPAGERVINVHGMLNIRSAVFRAIPSDLASMQAPLIVLLTLAILAASAWIWRQTDSRDVTSAGVGLLAITTVLTALHAHYHSGVIALIGIGLVIAALRERGDALAARRLAGITWVSFSLVPFALFLHVESSRMPAAFGTIVLLGLWSWIAWDLAARPREAAARMRVTAPAARIVQTSSGDRPRG